MDEIINGMREWSYLEILLFACLGMSIYIVGYYVGFNAMKNNALKIITDKFEKARKG